MAEETEREATEGTATPDGGEVDYKALYEAEKAHKREWEKRAKANKDAADELARAQEAGKTAEERIAELTRRLDEKERAEARAKVAAEKGVPADLIVGDTEEEMGEWADRMRSAFATKAAPKVERPGTFARSDGKPDDDGMRDVIRRSSVRIAQGAPEISQAGGYAPGLIRFAWGFGADWHPLPSRPSCAPLHVPHLNFDAGTPRSRPSCALRKKPCS